MAKPSLRNTLWFFLLISASTSTATSTSASSTSLATTSHPPPPPRRSLRAQQQQRELVSYPDGLSGDAVNILVVRPGCCVTYMGINFETGRSGYRIDCKEDEDDDDDFVAPLPGGTDDDDDDVPPPVEEDEDDDDAGVMIPPPVEEDDDDFVVPAQDDDDDFVAPAEEDDDGGAVPAQDDDDGMAPLDDDDGTGTFLDDEILGTDDDDGGPPPPVETDDDDGGNGDDGGNALPPPQNDDGGNALPQNDDDGTAPLDDDDGTETFLDDAILEEDDDGPSQGGSGGVGFFPDPAEDDDVDTVVAAAENEIIAQEDRNGLGQAGMAMVCFAVLGLLLLLCCCAYRKKQGGKDGALNDSDAERLLGGDIEEAYSSPSPYKDEDGYQPPDAALQDRGFATQANAKQRRMAGAWGGLEELEDEDQWEDYVQSLREYKSQQGDCLVSLFYRDEKDRPLGQWVSLQRHLRKAGELSQDKIDQLTAMGFVWGLQRGDGTPEEQGIVTDPTVWDQHLQSLVAYRELHGDCDVPFDYRDSEGRALGKWVHRQRNRASRGSLPMAQQRQLDALGFNWDGNISPRGSISGIAGDAGLFDLEDDKLWNEYFQCVKNYKAQHGDCLVPSHYRDPEDRPLGQWVTLQRHLAGAKELSQDKIDKLTAIGFVWELQDGDGTPEEHGIVTDSTVWGEHLESLKVYKRTHGDCNVPYFYVDSDGRALGKWAHRQRHRAKRGSLSKSQKAQLDALGFDWNVLGRRSSIGLGSLGYADIEDDSVWDEYVGSLTDYKSEQGDCIVPSNHRDPKSRPLGQWVTLQRHLAAADELSQEKMEQLDTLGFVWDLQEGDGTAEDHGIVTDPNVWEQYLASLGNYKKQYGDCDVPYSYRDDEGRALGKWVNHQKHRANRGTLSDSQEEKLASLGLNWSDPSTAASASLRGLALEEESNLVSAAQSVKSASTRGRSVKSASTRGSLLQRMFSSKKTMNESTRSQSAADSHISSKIKASNSIRSQSAADGSSPLSGQNIAAGAAGAAGVAGAAALLSSISIATGGSNPNHDLEDDSLWSQYVQSLVDYKFEHGDCLVPYTFRDSEQRPLGQWVTLQRHFAAAGDLDQEKIDELDALSFVWELQYGDGTAEEHGIVSDPKVWDQYLGALSDYKGKTGDCDVPYSFRDDEGRALGRWVHRQRHRAKRGTLSQSQEEQLDALGFDWEIPSDGGLERDLYLDEDDDVSLLKDGGASVLNAPSVKSASTRGSLLKRMFSSKKTMNDSIRSQSAAGGSSLISNNIMAIGAAGAAGTAGAAALLSSRSFGGAQRYQDLEDDSIGEEYVKALTDYKSQHGDCLVPSNFRDSEGRQLGQWVTLQRHLAAGGELTQPQIDELAALGFVWALQDGDGTAQDHGIFADPTFWDQYLASLTDFKKEKGHCNVPFYYLDTEGRPLGRWVHRQRHRAKRGSIFPDQRNKLSALGFDWDPSLGKFSGAYGGIEKFDDLEDDLLWREYVQSLTNYKAKNGDCLVPSRYRDEDRRPLGQWVTLQRHLSAANELPQDKVDELTALGFVWQLQAADGTAEDQGIVTDPRVWDQYLASLAEYKKGNGHCDVPYSYRDNEGRALGYWAQRQRSRQKRGTLSGSQKGKLDTLGFNWEYPYNSSRSAAVDRSMSVASSAVSTPKKRGSLLKRIFSSKKNMTDKSTVGERSAVAERSAVGDKPATATGNEAAADPHHLFGPEDNDRWEEYVQALKVYQASHDGDCNVPRAYTDSDSRKLGEWVSAQRVRNACNKLHQENFEELDALGFVWNLQPDDDNYRMGPILGDVVEDWDTYVASLKKYQKAHGDCMVPIDYKDTKNRPLGAWVSNVRDVAAQNELPPPKREELSKIGFDWESHRGDGYGVMGGCGYGRWEEYFDALVEYKVDHGDCSVPLEFRDGYGLELGAWVANQRHRADQDELPYSNQDRLTGLGFDWETQGQKGGGTPPEAVWGRHMQAILDYTGHYGNPDTIARTFEDWNGVGLGSWLINQSDKALAGKLHPTLKKELTGAGIDLKWFRNGGRDNRATPNKDDENDATRGPEIYADLLDNFKDEDDSSNDTGVAGNPSLNVHRCISATCDACKVHGGEEVSFLKTSDIV